MYTNSKQHAPSSPCTSKEREQGNEKISVQNECYMTHILEV